MRFAVDNLLSFCESVLLILFFSSDQTAKECLEAGATSVTSLVGDLSIPENCEKMIADATLAFKGGKIDTLFLNHAICTTAKVR